MIMSVIENFKNLIADYTDASDILKESVFLTGISGLVGRRAVILYDPKIRVFSQVAGSSVPSGMFLNVYSMIIGESRITRKSTTVGFLLDLIKNVREDLLVTQSFTPEALIDELKERDYGGTTQAIWLVDEAARFYESCRKKDYMAEAQSLLQQLYDGNDFTRRTKCGGTVKIRNPYFVTLFTTTPFVLEENLVKPSDFHHGFLNRFVLLRIKPVKEWKEAKFSEKLSKEKDAKNLLDWSKSLWYDVDKPMVFALTSKVIEKFNEFDRKIKDDIFDSKDATYQSYIGNFPEFLLKLMGLYRIVRINDFKLLKSVVVIEEEDFEKANDFLQSVKQSFLEIKAEIDKKTKTKMFTPVDTSDWEKLVVNTIEYFGGDADRSTLLKVLQKHGINAKTLDEITRELEQKDEITTYIKSHEGSGRKAISYRICKKE